MLAAVDRDLAVFRLRDAQVADSGLAAAARAMACQLDDPAASATSKSMCARALLELMCRLQELLPPEVEGDALDDLAARRAARIAGRSVS